MFIKVLIEQDREEMILNTDSVVTVTKDVSLEGMHLTVTLCTGRTFKICDTNSMKRLDDAMGVSL